MTDKCGSILKCGGCGMEAWGEDVRLGPVSRQGLV